MGRFISLTIIRSIEESFGDLGYIKLDDDSFLRALDMISHVMIGTIQVFHRLNRFPTARYVPRQDRRRQDHTQSIDNVSIKLFRILAGRNICSCEGRSRA